MIDDSVQQARLHLHRWRSPYDAGRFGFNFLERSGLMIATGANVPTENYAFVTYVDALDGSKSSRNWCRRRLQGAPYLRASRTLIPNPARK
ncbi:hypothetical protein [Sphingomonas sp. DT-204]|uniref:hypothetical protein n=1 Tax=Sphingomonas sp. DT-204 TaxID=3396166 RepID=UPI003F1E3001